LGASHWITPRKSVAETTLFFAQEEFRGFLAIPGTLAGAELFWPLAADECSVSSSQKKARNGLPPPGQALRVLIER